MVRPIPAPKPETPVDRADTTTLRDLIRFAAWARARTEITCDASDDEIARHVQRDLGEGNAAPRSPKFNEDYVALYVETIKRANNCARRVRALRNAELLPYGYLVVPHAPDACAAARERQHVCMRIGDTPELPLPECDRAHCKCVIRQGSARTMASDGIALPEPAPRPSLLARLFGRR